MNEWGVFLIAGEILGFLLLVLTPILKLNKTITTLQVTIEKQEERAKESEARNGKTHSRIFEELEDHEKELHNHDKRIVLLESEKTATRSS